jgi:hypothetical protein
MDVNKIIIKQSSFTDKQINIPVELNWDYLGLDMAIDEYEAAAINEVIGYGRDFEIDRFANAPMSGSPYSTAISYEFNFYSGGSLNDRTNWRNDYRSEGFTTGNIYYYDDNFTNSFFKLDLYDSIDEKKQKNYITLILPTQQGLKMDAINQRTPVTIKRPYFVLDYIGDKEGYFIYWLKKRTFLDIDTFYMTAKFYNGKYGTFTKMMNTPQSDIGTNYSFNAPSYFYYKVQLDYDKRSYQVFDVTTGERVGTPNSIKWYEYVNPPQ